MIGTVRDADRRVARRAGGGGRRRAACQIRHPRVEYSDVRGSEIGFDIYKRAQRWVW